MLVLLPIGLSEINFNVGYDITLGKILITVDKEGYSDDVRFYRGFYVAGEDPGPKFIGQIDLGCNNVKNCESVQYFGKIGKEGIYKPGDYYFVIWDSELQNSIPVDFSLTYNDLLSCDYNGVAIRTKTCVFDTTKNLNDKPQYCENQNLKNNCFICGCPNPDNFKEICCTNENSAECKGNLGACVILGEEKFERKITVEKEKRGETALTVIEKLGCGVETEESKYNVGDKICLNTIPGLYIDGFFPIKDPENHELFASQCVCTFIESNEFDVDGDGYDAKNFKGGTDCNDNNAIINPGAKESCEDATGYDGIDNNCDGTVDLKCDSYCDKDGDDYTTKAICVLMGKKTGDCDDTNANINPGIVESCSNDTGFDKLDNNCNGKVDESNCECRPGQKKVVDGVCEDGTAVCNSNGKWVVNVAPVNNCDPGILVHGYDPNGEIVVPSGQKIKVRTTFICQQNEGCDKLSVDLKEVNA
ncbi:MAG: hypothetical protein CMH63_02020 [Nanoarchaeota archaeon]|nr:hypothetical protein [Nanoarchaeota archaeon]|tara:strand:- start:120 stop:1541 length:1422 start_codon:yes stop_codon:yes gene_type:complete